MQSVVGVAMVPEAILEKLEPMLLHEEELLIFTRWEYPEDAYSRLDFASPPYLE